jgi:hypothetical protein
MLSTIYHSKIFVVTVSFYKNILVDCEYVDSKCYEKYE